MALRQYKVIGFKAVFSAGIVELTEAQAAVRLRNLDSRDLPKDKKTGIGQYRIINQIEFKAGEIFGYDGAINKAMLEDITPLEII